MVSGGFLLRGVQCTCDLKPGIFFFLLEALDFVNGIKQYITISVQYIENTLSSNKNINELQYCSLNIDLLFTRSCIYRVLFYLNTYRRSTLDLC